MDPDIKTDDMIIGDLRKSILDARQTKSAHVNTPKERVPNK